MVFNFLQDEYFLSEEPKVATGKDFGCNLISIHVVVDVDGRLTSLNLVGIVHKLLELVRNKL